MKTIILYYNMVHYIYAACSNHFYMPQIHVYTSFPCYIKGWIHQYVTLFKLNPKGHIS